MHHVTMMIRSHIGRCQSNTSHRLVKMMHWLFVAYGFVALLLFQGCYGQSFSDATSNEFYYKVLQIHGSGTTNPSKCLWNIMDEFMYSSSIPIRMTFRSIGTANGVAEFVNTTMTNTRLHQDNGTGAAVVVPPMSPSLPVFGIGDYPLSSTEYRQSNGIVDITKEVTSEESMIVQLPIVAGAVNFFYNLNESTTELKLDACLLARIFTCNITNWNHPDITMENPTLSNVSLPIQVVVRDGKSGSAMAISSYLHKACPEFFPSALVSDLPNWWSMNEGNYTNATGSQGMADMIDQNVGTIGFVDSGHGYENQISEIQLYNSFQYLTSYDSYVNNGFTAAVSRDDYPASPDLDFQQLQFVYQDAKRISSNLYMWPIVLVSTLYIPKDLTYVLPDPIERSLFYTFLQSLYDIDYMDVCTTKYMFATLPDDVQSFAKDGIALLMNYSANQYNVTTDSWYTEKKASTLAASYPYVISTRRSDLATIERDALQQQIDEVQTTLQNLVATMEHFETVQTLPQPQQQDSTAAAANTSTSNVNEKRIDISLAFSTISFMLWILYGLMMVKQMFCATTTATNGNKSDYDKHNHRLTANGTGRNDSLEDDNDHDPVNISHDDSAPGHV